MKALNKAWRKVKKSTLVKCWRNAGILLKKNDYIVKLINLELDIQHKEKIENTKMLEKFRVGCVY